MIIALLVTAVVSAHSTAAVQPARVRVRIVNGAKISSETWKRQSGAKERLYRDDRGRLVRLRIVEFE
jgi:hypothetical protein